MRCPRSSSHRPPLNRATPAGCWSAIAIRACVSTGCFMKSSSISAPATPWSSTIRAPSPRACWAARRKRAARWSFCCCAAATGIAGKCWPAPASGCSPAPSASSAKGRCARGCWSAPPPTAAGWCVLNTRACSRRCWSAWAPCPFRRTSTPGWKTRSATTPSMPDSTAPPPRPRPACTLRPGCWSASGKRAWTSCPSCCTSGWEPSAR